MKWVWWGVIAVIVLLGIYSIYAVVDTIAASRTDTQVEERKAFEQAYFEGQRDALSGDVRIRMVDNRTFVWLRSPWADKTKPFSDTLYSLGGYVKPLR